MSEDMSGSAVDYMTARQADSYRTAAGILLSDERSKEQIKDVILYRDTRGSPKLAVVHKFPMHDNFFISGDEQTYDCNGFVGEIIMSASRDLPMRLRQGPVEIGCVTTELCEELPRELGIALEGQHEDLFMAFSRGKAFNLDTGRFDISPGKAYPQTTSSLESAFRSGWHQN